MLHGGNRQSGLSSSSSSSQAKASFAHPRRALPPLVHGRREKTNGYIKCPESLEQRNMYVYGVPYTSQTVGFGFVRGWGEGVKIFRVI